MAEDENPSTSDEGVDQEIVHNDINKEWILSLIHI